MLKIISNLIYMENLPDIKLKNSAFTFALENTLIQSIVNKIKLIPQFDQLKNDIEITEHVCNLVENSVTNNKDSKPINKKQLVIKIMSSLFNLNNDADKKIVDQQIDYLFNNNMIQKISLSSKIYRFLKNAVVKYISWIMNNFINNSLKNQFPLQINNKYQIIISYGLTKYGLSKSIILLVLLCLWFILLILLVFLN